MHPGLSAHPLPDVLRLIRTPHIGSVSFFSLLRRYGSPKAALEALPALKPLRTPPPMADIEREIEQTHAFGARFILYGDAEYPPLLLEVPDAPPALILLGKSSLWQGSVLGMVGARNASAAACQLAQQFARELGQQGVAVASGLARGIDAHAHKGALKTGTIGVIAGGIDSIYPPENKSLYAQMAEEGAILTEQPFGQQPFASAFPSRNRIIAGLSHGVLVVEAAPQSGSLITARLAGEYNRELMAIPGSPLDPRAKSCNQLLRDGATMVETSADILEALRQPRRLPLQTTLFESPATYAHAHTEARAPTHTRAQVLEKLSPNPVLVDELLEQCETTASELQAILLELELAGTLARTAGNKVYIIDKSEEVA